MKPPVLYLPRVSHPRANATVLIIGPRRWIFSYETCIAYSDERVSVRRFGNFSATTTRHFTECCCASWDKLPDAEFERAAGIAAALVGVLA